MSNAERIPEISQGDGFSGKTAARRDRLKALGLAALLNAFLFGLVFAVTTPCYETNDDFCMQKIASGFFTGQPSEYLVFTSFLIGWPLRAFYSLWPGINWYFAYLVAVHYAALTVIAFLILSRRTGWAFAFLYAGFFLLVETRNLLELQFTTTAFLAGTAGVLLLVEGLPAVRAPRWLLVIAGYAFTGLMVMIREPVAPLLVLIALPFLIERFGLAEWRRLLVTGVVCAAMLVALQVANRWYYSRDPAWAQFREYNGLRGQIHETRLKPFILQAAPTVGWSDNDARLFRAFYFPEPEIYASVSKMRLFVDRLKGLAGPEPLFFRNAPARSLFLPTIFSRDSSLLLKLALLNAAWCVYAARSQRRRCFNTLLALYALFVVLSLYLRATARLPDRVSYNMPLFLNVICLYWASGFHALPPVASGANLLDRLLPTFTRLGVWRWISRALVIGFAVLYVLLTYHLGESLWYANAFNRHLKVISRKIFEPVRTLLPPGQNPILVPLPYDSFLEQSVFFYPKSEMVPFSLVPAYGWLTHSPLFRQILAKHQLHPYSLSLVDRRDVFILMEKKWLEPLQIFYREHYGLEIKFDLVLNTDEMPEYRMCRLYLYQAHAVQPKSGVGAIP